MKAFLLTKEKKDAMIEAIKRYFYAEREEDLGDLAATLILDFFTKELAPEFYNLGINDAYKYMNDKLDEVFDLQIYK